MKNMPVDIKVRGLYGLNAILLIVGYFIYDKNHLVASFIIGAGVVLITALTISEICYRHSRTNRYKGYRKSRRR